MLTFSDDRHDRFCLLRRAIIATLVLCSVSCDTQEAAASGRVQFAYRSDPAESARTARVIHHGFNGVPYLAQWAPRWGSLRYGDNPACSTFTDGGCGPTAIAMVLRHYGIDADPIAIGEIAVSAGARRCPGGTDAANMSFLRSLAERYGFDITHFHHENDRVLSLLREHEPIIAVGAVAGYTANHDRKFYSSHFVVLTGVDAFRHHRREQPIVRVNDSGNPDRHGITYMTIDQFWGVHRFLYLRPSARTSATVAMEGAEEPRRASGQCTRIDELRTWQPQVVSRTLETSSWVGYGLALASCGPESRPWDALGAGDRERFVDDYVVPFLNGDVLLGSPFRQLARTSHERIMHAWGLDGG